ncbi:relaxase/mobilization nuclease domain-containing protein [Ectopseudomonas khazarica]|uniref:relaxase/mobilization nuclease domain-containing protein n=1 Tax=Ectopseudomonas khazarica TaxID=2502979 RepID=UPI0037C5C75E
MIREKLSTQKDKGETQNTLGYALKKSALIDSNRLQTGTTQEFIEFLAKKFDKACKGKQHNTSFHEMVSFDPSDKITPEQALSIAKELYEHTHGLNREHAFAVHTDKKHIHVHFVWAPRDFNNKIYNQVDDFRIIEQKLTDLEQKHGLTQVTNRKSLKPDLETQPPQNKKEQALEKRGLTSKKKQFKDELKELINDSINTTAFFNIMSLSGYSFIQNGKTGYSVEKEGETFKASDLGIHYKALKKNLEEIHQFDELLEYYSKKPKENHIALIKTNEETYFMKGKYKKTLHKDFTQQNKNNSVEYYYKNSTNKKAFEYHKDPSKVQFNDLSSKSIKAGLQRLTADMKKPGPLTCSGPDWAKKKMWMEFHMMNLEAKGFTLSGYKPTPADTKELEIRKAEYAEKLKEWKKNDQQNPPKQAIEALESTQPLPKHQEEPNPLKNDIEQPTDMLDDFKVFVNELLEEYSEYDEKEILENIRDVLEGNIIYDAEIFDKIIERVKDLDDETKKVFLEHINKLLDDGDSGSPIDGKLKAASKKWNRYKI